MVNSQDKPQNFPIYSMHLDMDSFILYNAGICPKADVKLLETTQTKNINEQSSAQDQETIKVVDATNE